MKPIQHQDLKTQLDWIKNLLENDKIIMDILNVRISHKINAYLGAGSINQRIWNKLTNRDSTYGIDDYDIVYYQPEDIRKETEDRIQDQYNELFPKLDIECTNQARVHTWYKEYTGRDIDPITSVEDGINRWATTATAIAVYLKNSELKIFAPRGLTDVLSLTVRAIKKDITKEIYLKKTKRWKSKWPELNVLSWEES